ncbi:hypothetical protein AV521_13200 [Streptomyces sp. IMTB 2501]|uniref:helix-turn-helix transcriptional regulator n=1 Tax=Streptomyces sp. IMTB 2501 TaxID=1776340 RepID=UPI00096E9017|nr:helix-turn-helix transcriptional regulator [Streptomyces sp. IMTB 2501]OLZ70949.1 hypothetical protein AV521_13200 [Streptomyces sp. IMTB 2501]
MPPRLFDGRRVRAARRGKDLTQKQLGAAVGVTGTAVARWESGEDFPPGEKLPALAAVLGEPIDVLFPRDGMPDLADLRCDAGLSQREAAEAIGASRVPLSNAERGKRKLNDAYIEPLANAYKATTEELLAAQERSFGNLAPDEPSAEQRPIPRTLAEKITYMMTTYPPGNQPPQDAEIAQAINAKAGRDLVTVDVVLALRTGAQTVVGPQNPAVLEGLAEVFGVPVMYFQPNEQAARQITEVAELLKAINDRKILALAARGNEDGLSPDMISIVADLAAGIRTGTIPGDDR